MDIKVISVGKLKEKYLKQGIAEYTKRIKAYSKYEIVEVADEPAPENLSEADMEIVKAKEAERILGKIPRDAYVFTLEIGGREYSSEAFSKEIEKLMVHGKSKIYFVIGGSLGLHQSVLDRSNASLSFGKMTYPHQLMRLILSEQIYRSFKIMKGEPYHK